jgi:hypothetical protein
MAYVNQAESIARIPQAADKTYLCAATAPASRRAETANVLAGARGRASRA